MLIDLQTHSTYSDGYLTPTEVARFLAKQGVKVAALTDHNTVAGINEFKIACKAYKIKPIVGMELYVKYKNSHANLLWYNFNRHAHELHDMLRDSQIRRKTRIRMALNKLIKKGYNIEINKILDKYNHYVPINHLTADIISVPANRKILKKKLKIKNPREEDIIGELFWNKNFKLKETYTNVEKILKLKKRIGGQLVLCHPAKYSYIVEQKWQKYKKLGLDGVEVLSPHHSYGAIMYIQYLTNKFDFVETGGSDFHRFEGDDALIQDSWNYYKIDTKYLKNIEKIIG